jgi:cell division septation protein DedD
VKSKDYREIQLSSTQLVFIVFGILVVGVVIFLLGVSVGKKQAQVIKSSEITSPAEVEQAKSKVTAAPPPAPSTTAPTTSPGPTTSQPVKPKDTITKELASHQKIKEENQKPAPGIKKEGAYYIQIIALDDKKAALSVAEGFKKKGYNAVVLDPFPKDKKPLYRVRIGGYETKEKAEEVRDKLKREARTKVDYFVTKT